MSRKPLRFSVTDGDGNRSSTWKCFAANSPKNDVYLTCREIGGALKASLHESGNWHFAYNKCFFDENIGEFDRGRFIEKWSRPREIAPGVTLALRIVIPWGSVGIPIDTNFKKNIYWVNKPSDGHAIEFDLIITAKDSKISDWPGKIGMNTQLVGSFKLSNGDIFWVVYQEIEMPKIKQQSGNLKFYKGKGEEELKSNNLRMQAFDVEEDGSRVIYDFSVQFTRNGT